MTREEAKTAKVNVEHTGGGPYNYAATFDNYDGAEDSPNRGVIGYGMTKDEAVKDLMDVAELHYDWELEGEELAKWIADHPELNDCDPEDREAND